jgi:antitoxin VapB
MADIAKVFMSGRSQAVRLPKKYRFDCDEVEVSQEGDALVLRPRTKPWANLTAVLESFDAARFEGCFPQGREQPKEQERPALDDLLGR